VKVIGHITRPELGSQLITRDGNEFALRAQGWDGFGDNGRSATPDADGQV